MSVRCVNNLKLVIAAFQHLDECAEQMGIEAVATVQAVTPVDTGALRRSKTFKIVRPTKFRTKVVVGTIVQYAPMVNGKGKHRKYFDRALASYSPRARQILLNKMKQMRWIK